MYLVREYIISQHIKNMTPILRIVRYIIQFIFVLFLLVRIHLNILLTLHRQMIELVFKVGTYITSLILLLISPPHYY